MPQRFPLPAWLTAALDLLFPPGCPACGRESDPWQGSPAEAGPPSLCAPCSAEMAAGGERCVRCGADAEPGRCRACLGRPSDHDGIVVLGDYHGALRAAVLRAKRPGGRTLAEGLARLLHRRHDAAVAAWGVDVVVPVPMHWRRRLIRGTSAAEILARRLAEEAGRPWAPLLRRRRATVTQNRLPPEGRRANVRGAFAARPRDVAGRRILLVDDVCTTGGTIAACREALVGAGAAAVFAAVIARAGGGGDDGGPDPA